MNLRKSRLFLRKRLINIFQQGLLTFTILRLLTEAMAFTINNLKSIINDWMQKVC